MWTLQLITLPRVKGTLAQMVFVQLRVFRVTATLVYCQRCPAHGTRSVDLTPRFWTWIVAATDRGRGDLAKGSYAFAIKRPVVTDWCMVELFCPAALSAAETDHRTAASICRTSSSHTRVVGWPLAVNWMYHYCLLLAVGGTSSVYVHVEMLYRGHTSETH